MSAERGQPAPQFRLKNHYQRDCEENGKASNNPADHNKVQEGRDQCQRQKNDRQSGQDFRAARPPKIKIAVIYGYAQQNDFKGAAPSSGPKMDELINHLLFSRTASVMCNAF